jgi:hypothetical protein
MKKKMKDKQRSRHEVESTNKLNYLPPSPPPQKKSPKNQDYLQQHYQSSSSPVGRPPPVSLLPHMSTQEDNISESDHRVLEDLKAFLAASSAEVTTNEGGEASTSLLLPVFIQEQQLDVCLYDDMSFSGEEDEGMEDFFPTLPNNKS